MVLSKERTHEQTCEWKEEWSGLRNGERAHWAEDTPRARAWYNNALEDQGAVRRPGCPQWRGGKENIEMEAEKQARCQPRSHGNRCTIIFVLSARGKPLTDFKQRDLMNWSKKIASLTMRKRWSFQKILLDQLDIYFLSNLTHTFYAIHMEKNFFHLNVI